MALSRDNPVAISVLSESSPGIGAQIEELVDTIRSVDEANAGWSRRQLEFIKMQYGKRRKRNVPWKNASNISVPLISGIQRRWRPGITSLILDANPIAFFTSREPTDFEPARIAEPFFTYLFLDRMEGAAEVPRLVDLIASRGFAYARSGWLYETEKDTRIVLATKLFPQGLGNFVQSRQSQLMQSVGPGQAPNEAALDPVRIVAERLAAEYGLDIEDEDEGLMLLQASQQLLNGADKVRLTYEHLEEDRPDWQAVDPLHTIAERSACPQKGEFFVVIHEMSSHKVKNRIADGYFDEARGRDLLERMQTKGRDSRSTAGRTGSSGGSAVRQQVEDFMQRRAGNTSVDTAKPAIHRAAIWETFCLLDIDGDGEKERCVLWYAPEFDIPLAVYRYPMPFREWPIVTYLYEGHAPTQYDSRGIPELLFELQKLVNAFHNARVDASQIVLAPVMQRKASSADYGQRVQWRPGAMIPVQNVGDIQPIPHDLRILDGLLLQEQQTQRIAEAFIGTFDATLNQLSQPTERRTAAEVQAITSLAQNVFGLDARYFQISMARSFKQIWKLWMEFGPEEMFFRVMGEPQPRLARKSEIDMEFDITPAGSPSSTNKAFLMANLERILQITISDTSGRFDVGTLLEKYFKLIDFNLAKDIVRSPDETRAAQAVQQAAQQVTGEAFQV